MSDSKKDARRSSPESSRAVESSIPQGRLSRGLKLGTAFLGAAGRATGRALSGRAGAAMGSEALALAHTLGRLKGLSMKLGQMLSYMDIGSASAWSEALASLQHESPPMPREVVTRVVEDDLGAPPNELFDEWDWTPVAAASIGQVHRARLADGTPVAVKVRYPEIDEVMRQDLDNVGLLRRLTAALAPELDTRALVLELKDRLLEECDYRREAEHQAQFRQFFAGHRGVLVPEVYAPYSSARVLTSTFVEGTRFDEFSRGASEHARNRAGCLIHNFAFRSIFEFGALNCDPHPGNYLFGEASVAFLDFGCVRHFGDDLRHVWRTMLRSALEQDHSAFREAVVEIGLARPRSRFDFDAHYRQYLLLIRPWLTEEAALLTPEFVKESYRALLWSNPNRAHINMPRELLFANRLQWGLYSVLARLRPTCVLRHEILDILYSSDEPRPPEFSDAELRRYRIAPR